MPLRQKYSAVEKGICVVISNGQNIFIGVALCTTKHRVPEPKLQLVEHKTKSFKSVQRKI